MAVAGEIRGGKELGYPYPHRRLLRACADCGRERWVRQSKGIPRHALCRSCSIKLRHIRAKGPDANHYKGGRHKTTAGYIRLLILPGDFFHPMATKHNYVFEHRLVVAKQVGRCLLPWEVVHHRNGIKDDNRLENLQLLAHGRHHVADSLMKGYVGRLEKRVTELEARVVLLEAELAVQSAEAARFTD
ncbi:hypothetical protein LCGC14_1543760 [marine sediment metagenome]|uniref:HNH nuclease domain-containing protein n=1 Tax=marine sediment metagenome TaxID=412755 RepID=A0A0F9IS71_9ZZZZ